VGEELTIGVDARSDGARRLARRVPSVTSRAFVDFARGQAGAARAPVPIMASQAMAAGLVVDVSWSAFTAEPEEIITRLQTERAAAHAGFSHPHTAVGCVFCRRAAAAYR
jgi:hypothetical protein